MANCGHYYSSYCSNNDFILFSNNDVILLSVGGGGLKGQKIAVILNVWPLCKGCPKRPVTFLCLFAVNFDTFNFELEEV